MAKRKHRRMSVTQQEYDDLSRLAHNNVIARVEGPRTKRWSKHDVRPIHPMTPNQQIMFDLYDRDQFIIAAGSPGTGKTFLSLYLALTSVVDKSTPYNHIKIVRSVVPSREMGHLPGTVEEKSAPYEAVYQDALHELCGRGDTYKNMKEAGLISFVPTSFVRGSTWNDTIVIIDEAQNMTWHELHSVITRVGTNSRLLIAGDGRQCDLNQRKEQSGFYELLKVANIVPQFSTIMFTPDDCVRCDFVKDWLAACEKLGYI